MDMKNYFVIIIMMCACMSFIQDLIGEERYIYLIQQHWTPSYITIPISIGIIIYCMFILNKNITKTYDKNREKNI